MVKSAGRVIQILKLIGTTNNGLKHTEIAKKLNIPKGSLSFLLADLVSEEFLILESNGRYRIGLQILVLANNYLSNLDITKISDPILKEVVEATNEAVGVAIRNKGDVIIVARRNAPQQLKIEFEIGQSFPMFASAAGKAILAHLSDEEIEAYLSAEIFSPITPRTIIDQDQLRTELKKIRRDSVSVSIEENVEGRAAMAVPVFNNNGKVLFAIAQPVPTIRFSAQKQEMIKQVLRSAAQKLSTAYGYKPFGNSKQSYHRGYSPM